MLPVCYPPQFRDQPVQCLRSYKPDSNLPDRRKPRVPERGPCAYYCVLEKINVNKKISQNALVQAPDVPSLGVPVTITLLPALPKQWSCGSIRGARIRGGITLDLSWTRGKLTIATLQVDGGNVVERPVRVFYAGREVMAFATAAGMRKILRF